MRLATIRPTAALARVGAPARARGMAAGAKFVKYDWQDPLRMQSLLTDEELAIQETARSYAQEKLVPRVLEGWRTVSGHLTVEADTLQEVLDVNILKEMGALGLLGPTIKGYGCAGTNYISYGLIMREVER